MSRTLDNANPTIFAAPAAAPSSSRQKSPKSMLWDEDSAAWEEDESSGSEERQEIDAEEVYGERFLTRVWLLLLAGPVHAYFDSCK